MELQILDYIQTLRTPVLDVIMPALSALCNAGIIWIVLAVVLLIPKKTRKAGAMIAAALIFELILGNGILKHLVARTRPCDVNTAVELLIKRPHDYSFPSGHAASSFAATTALFFAGNKKMGTAALVLSCLIAFSRLYLYVHYPTDILGGVILGTFCGWLASLVVGRIIEARRK